MRHEKCPEDEIRYVGEYFRRNLAVFESLRLGRASEAEVLACLDRATSMKQALEDLASPDGGSYVALSDTLDRILNVSARLAAFIKRGRMSLGVDESALNRWHSWDDLTGSCHVDKSKGFRRVELAYYLEDLEADALSMVGVPDDVGLSAAFPITVRELIAFLDHLVKNVEGSTIPKGAHRCFLFLLRDTLLLYLGMRYLERASYPVQARAVMVSRALLRHFGESAPENPLYDTLFTQFYACLIEHKGSFRKRYAERFARALSAEERENDRLASLCMFIRQYCRATLDRGQHYCVVESGVHGVLPLLVMSAVPEVTDFRMYTATPWLHAFYGKALFSTRSKLMRVLEAAACQEHLFSFAGIRRNKVMVDATLDPRVRGLALTEIRLFLEAVGRHFGIDNSRSH